MRAEGIPEVTYALFCKRGTGDDAENAGQRELGESSCWCCLCGNDVSQMEAVDRGGRWI